MKRERRAFTGLWMAVFAVTSFVLAFLAGCGANGLKDSAAVPGASVMQNSASMADGGIYGAADYNLQEEAEAGSGTAGQPDSGRKLIKTVSMDVETEDFDGLLVKLENRVKDLNGYIESSNVRGNARYNENRYSSMTIRIPSGELDNFVNEVAEISNITWKSENIEDITLNYVDVESRKKALEVEQERLMALLEKAESVEDIISIESRLSDVRYELQSYASRLLIYDNQVDYSTVNLDIREVKRLTPQEEPTVWERISTGFVDNFKGVLKLIENVAVGVVILIPYWGVLVILIVIVIAVCKGISVMQKKRKEKNKDKIQKNETEKRADEKKEG